MSKSGVVLIKTEYRPNKQVMKKVREEIKMNRSKTPVKLLAEDVKELKTEGKEIRDNIKIQLKSMSYSNDPVMIKKYFEKRIDNLEERFEHFRERLEKFEQRINRFEEELDSFHFGRRF